jgi:hypothetical protein
MSTASAFGAATCPENTKWDGTNCVDYDTGEPIVFTDYSGNIVKKSKPKVQEDSSPISLTKPQHEILTDLMIKKPEIQAQDDKAGKALEQKIQNDKLVPANMTRENYHFQKIIEWSTKNSLIVFENIFGNEIKNEEFGENNEYQIQYDKRYNRSEDPVLQQDILNENKRAQKIFFINWGNFTNH